MKKSFLITTALLSLTVMQPAFSASPSNVEKLEQPHAPTPVGKHHHKHMKKMNKAEAIKACEEGIAKVKDMGNNLEADAKNEFNFHLAVINAALEAMKATKGEDVKCFSRASHKHISKIEKLLKEEAKKEEKAKKKEMKEEKKKDDKKEEETKK